jgi:catechol 2,3-dioxygenase-like lactoylglutathione lyase family enzyme
MSAAIGEFGPNVLFVEDVARSRDFYVDVLGFAFGFGDETNAGVFLGDELLLLVAVPSAAEMLAGEELGTPRTQRGVALFNIFVEDVDVTFERLRSLGVKFIVDPMDREWGRRTAHFKDPDGFIWEISQSIESAT